MGKRGNRMSQALVGSAAVRDLAKETKKGKDCGVVPTVLL